jgi:hypothetical protein
MDAASYAYWSVKLFVNNEWQMCGKKRPWPIFTVFPFAGNNYGNSRKVSAKKVGKLPT